MAAPAEPFFRPLTPWTTLLVIGCAYEIVAVVTPLPTITKLTHLAKNHSLATRIIVWAAMGASVWHFFVED